MTLESLRSQYELFRRLRWVGIGLFGLAIPIPFAAIAVAALHGGRWLWLLPAIGCLGLSLGSFGTANDTAIHALRELGKRGAVPPHGAAELRTELTRRPARLEAVHASPKASFLIPLLAVSLIGWMSLRLWGAWTA